MAVGVLTLAIGAGTAVFSLVDAVVLRGLPFDEHDRIAAVLEHDPQRPATFGGGTTTAQTFLDWRREQKVFRYITAVGGARFRLRNERGEPDDAWAQRVSWEFFPVLGMAPMLGRAFTPEDEIWGRHRVVILTHGAWLRRLGGSPEILRKTVQLDEEPWEVVGVMPPGFSYPVGSARPAEMLAPLAFRDFERSRERAGRNYNWTVIGRLKDGVTIEQAHEQMFALTAALDAQYPKWSPGHRARVIPLREHLVGRVRDWMLLLLGAVGLVQLMACANLANLMLARATARMRDMAVRAALGAGRARLALSLLAESLVLSLAGGGLGILLASYGVDVLRAWLPTNVPRVADVGIDVRVLGAAVGAALLTGFIFGMVPALQSSRPDAAAALRSGSRGAGASPLGERLRSALVVTEVALAVVLVVGAGLFIGSFARLMRIEPGFAYQNLLAVSVGVDTRGGFEEARQRGRPYVEQMLEAARAVPGVEMAGAVSGGLPFSGSWSRVPVSLPGRGELPGDGASWDDNSIDKRTITTEYLQVLRVPLRRGRYFNEQDREGAELVTVINEAAARKYWPAQKRSANASPWTTWSAPSSGLSAISATSARRRLPARKPTRRSRKARSSA